MAVRDEWNEALNTIRQQAAYLVQQLDERDRDHKTAVKRADALSHDLDNARKRTHSLEYGVMRASLEDRIHALEDEVNKCREYMRLKDNAKIKVEQQRDACKERALYWEQRFKDKYTKQAWEKQKGKVTELEAQNERQAQAFRELENRFAVEVQKREDAERVAKNVQDVLLLGMEGLRAEIQRGERW